MDGLRAYTLVCSLLLLLNRSHSSSTVDTLQLGDSLTGNHTVISKNGMFELGLFCPGHCYIGIWYVETIEYQMNRMIVWVGKRETPITMRGVLRLSRDGYLGLFDMDALVWSPDVTEKASRAVILDSGNFVLLGGHNLSEIIIWQSFDHPGDSWLPGMKLRRGQKLLPWKNVSDPAPGHFSFQMDPSGAPKIVLRWKNSVQYWESEFRALGRFGLRIQEDSTSYSYLTYNSSLHPFMRFVINMDGILRTDYYANFSWWKGELLDNRCDVYNFCGVYGVRSSDKDIDDCSCLEGGFSPKNELWYKKEWWSSGCERVTRLNCSTDIFVESKVWMPDNDAYSYPAGTRKTCEAMCIRNCSCTAFSYIPAAGHCIIFVGDLRNLQRSFDTSLFVRVAYNAAHPRPSSPRKRIPIVVGELLAVFLIWSCSVINIARILWRRPSVSTVGCDESSTASTSLRMFSYMELKTATGNFKHKLGSGGFGAVYKGTLTDGTVAAVKKLEGSKLADKQFQAEISSVGNIHHMNLIRLKGFCADGSRRLLVYDCMPNGSLNSFLFNPNSERQGKTLDWKTRFTIALGIARALRYLHDECRDRIIHADVKPENVLLDADFSPKLGDFGLAKLLGRDFSHVLTTTRGTRGYLAPEWISGLPITPKVDVYSFGMTRSR